MSLIIINKFILFDISSSFRVWYICNLGFLVPFFYVDSLVGNFQLKDVLFS